MMTPLRQVVFTTLLALVLYIGSLENAHGKTLASSLEIYVFPTQGQDASQQSQDEAACYDWAVGNTGTDPFALTKQEQTNQQQSQSEQQAAQQAGQGSGARGAVRGAAAGALIGEIANDDAGEGAAWGAAVGMVHGRRQGRQAQAQAQQQAAASSSQRQQATAQQMTNFNKAFSVCLEAKNYMVK